MSTILKIIITAAAAWLSLAVVINPASAQSVEDLAAQVERMAPMPERITALEDEVKALRIQVRDLMQVTVPAMQTRIDALAALAGKVPRIDFDLASLKSTAVQVGKPLAAGAALSFADGDGGVIELHLVLMPDGSALSVDWPAVGQRVDFRPGWIECSAGAC